MGLIIRPETSVHYHCILSNIPEECTSHLQGDHNVSVHQMITIHVTPLSQHTSFLPKYLAQYDCLAADRQGQGDTRLTLTPSVIPNSNYVFMVID
jgi:hypothetical protein